MDCVDYDGDSTGLHMSSSSRVTLAAKYPWALATGACLQTSAELQAAKMQCRARLVGVVGYCIPFDDVPNRDSPNPNAKELVTESFNVLFDDIHRRCEAHSEEKAAQPVWIVSGATDSTVPGLCFRLAEERGLTRVGFTAAEAGNFPMAKMERCVIVGDKFGDESEEFVSNIDEMWVVGGGKQSANEARMAAKMGKDVVLVRGIGGAAEEILDDEAPNARILKAAVGEVPSSTQHPELHSLAGDLQGYGTAG